MMREVVDYGMKSIEARREAIYSLASLKKSFLSCSSRRCVAKSPKQESKQKEAARTSLSVVKYTYVT